MKAIRISIVGILWAVYFMFWNLLTPVISNEVAVKQLDDTAESFIQMRYFESIKHYIVWILIVITVLIFIPEIKKIIEKIRKGIRK